MTNITFSDFNLYFKEATRENILTNKQLKEKEKVLF